MTHWKKLTNPDYLGAYALEPGQEIVATIRSVGTEQVVGTDGKKEECTVAHFAERSIKPMILNATNCKTITKLSGSPYIENWAGTRIQIYVDKVKAFGDVVEALRIRPTSPKAPESIPPCEECGGKIDAVPDWKMSAQQVADYTRKNTGRHLCKECALAEKARREQEASDDTDQ